MGIAVLPTGLILTRCSFGDDCTEPPEPPCSGENTLVDNRAAAPKSCLPCLKMRTTTAAGGLLPTGETSTASKITFNKQTLRFYSTEEMNPKETNLWTSVPSACSDINFWRNKLLAAPSCRRVMEIKSMQNRMFDSGSSQGRLRAWPFWGSWRTLLCGEVMRVGATGRGCSFFRRRFAGSLKQGRL